MSISPNITLTVFLHSHDKLFIIIIIIIIINQHLYGALNNEHSALQKYNIQNGSRNKYNEH